MAPRSPAVRAPTQARSQRSFDRMLEAAEQLIRDRGYEAVTIADVVREARTSVGSFYGRFEDKTALMRALQDRIFTRVEGLFEAQSVEVAACATLAEAVTQLVENFVRLVSQDAPLVRAFGEQACVDASMRERADLYTARHFKYFSDMLRLHSAEIRHPNPERAIRFAYGAYLGISTSLGWDPGSPGARFSPAHMITELSRILTAYLQAPHPPAAPRAASRTRRKR